MIGFTPGGDPQEAKNGIIRSEIRPSYTRNTKNSFFQATSGASFFAQISFAGGPLGGSYNLIRPWVEYQKFIRTGGLAVVDTLLHFASAPSTSGPMGN